MHKSRQRYENKSNKAIKKVFEFIIFFKNYFWGTKGLKRSRGQRGDGVFSVVSRSLHFVSDIESHLRHLLTETTLFSKVLVYTVEIFVNQRYCLLD